MKITLLWLACCLAACAVFVPGCGESPQPVVEALSLSVAPLEFVALPLATQRDTVVAVAGQAHGGAVHDLGEGGILADFYLVGGGALHRLPFHHRGHLHQLIAVARAKELRRVCAGGRVGAVDPKRRVKTGAPGLAGVVEHLVELVEGGDLPVVIHVQCWGKWIIQRRRGAQVF